MAVLKSSILFPSPLIGVVTSGVSTFGLFAGSQLGKTFGKRMEILGGLILVASGVRTVVTHLV